MKLLRGLPLLLLSVILSCKDTTPKKDMELLIGRNDYTINSVDGHQIYIITKDKQKKLMNGYYIIGNKLQKWEEFEVENGLLNGVYITYHPESGSVFNKQQYKKGVLDGNDSIFYVSGKLKNVKNYKKGVIDGEAYGYFESGQLHTKTVYENEKVVKSISYDNLGHITSQMFIKDGRRITQNIRNGKVFSEQISSTYDNFEAMKFFNEDGSIKMFLRMLDQDDNHYLIELNEQGDEIKRIDFKANPQEILKYRQYLRAF